MLDDTQESNLADLHSTADYLYQEAFLEAARTSPSTNYVKRDFLFRPGTWRGNRAEPVGWWLGQSGNLLIGHSDIATTSADVLRIRLSTRYRKIFATNLASAPSFAGRLGAEILPLGLSNPTTESELHIVCGNLAALAEAHSARSRALRADDLSYVYANFTVATAPAHRDELMRFVKTLRHVKVDSPNVTSAGRAGYLREIRTAGLVICPRGNGLDTHRLYETLYLGSIPIVLAGSYQYRLCRTLGFPVVGLDGWSQLSDFSLLRGLAAAEKFSLSGLSRLRLSTWADVIGF